ncbi:uncharacterized protein STEHIDRAFT_170075 [Stereum hirsutum FP-91666 SS1]|uniref:uncharacterized protein n=1 Tax=Stereum hirsutum (strain FP-91666) TaxID=721885 RepID=UPI0004449D84|nr:uncharacterized protein STEHIDRAFT_170075 [Stereum hirsutum FP-91666 SS1]EIM84361.1 hypothetical protein STEHIDRAFT_170075 [Stereum hirsutum FP-91666 SS1]
MERSISDYRSRHPVPSCLIDRIVRGTPGTSERRFVSKAGERLPTLSSFGLCSILQLLVSLMAQLSLESSHRLELLRAVSSSSSLLPYLFSVLNGVAKVKPDYGCQPDLVASIITDLLLSVISKVAMDYPELSEAFMGICGRAGLVEAIEAAFMRFPQRSILTRISSIAEALVVLIQKSPKVLPSLRTHFPRPKMVREWLVLSRISPSGGRNTSSQVSLNGRWHSIVHLEAICLVDGQCMRRGCRRRWRGQCKDCRSTRYCGRKCQKEDWSEHRVICGFLCDGPDDEAELFVDRRRQPRRLPFRYDDNSPGVRDTTVQYRICMHRLSTFYS